MLETVEVKEKEKPKKDKLELWCESCGEKWVRWDMDIVEPTEDFILVTDDYNIACPVCVTEKKMIQSHSEYAVKFRSVNDELRKTLSEVPVN